MAPEQKTEKFLLRMGLTEVRFLEDLADHTGQTRADVVRQLIRREHAAVFGASPAKVKRKRK
jgi:hypothetical protein